MRKGKALESQNKKSKDVPSKRKAERGGNTSGSQEKGNLGGSKKGTSLTPPKGGTFPPGTKTRTKFRGRGKNMGRQGWNGKGQTGCFGVFIQSWGGSRKLGGKNRKWGQEKATTRRAVPDGERTTTPTIGDLRTPCQPERRSPKRPWAKKSARRKQGHGTASIRKKKNATRNETERQDETDKQGEKKATTSSRKCKKIDGTVSTPNTRLHHEKGLRRKGGRGGNGGGEAPCRFQEQTGPKKVGFNPIDRSKNTQRREKELY